MIQALLIFIAVLFLSSIAINGFYNITRGWWVTEPDGSKKWVGKIFKFYGKWLDQHTIKIKYFSGKEYIKEFYKVWDFLKENDCIVSSFKDDFAIIIVRVGIDETIVNLSAYCHNKGILIDLKMEDNTEFKLSFFKEEKKLKLPFWVEQPLGGCLSCMSSVFGSLCFWFWYFLFTTNGYSIELQWYFLIGIWIFFCVCLAYLNQLLYNVCNPQK